MKIILASSSAARKRGLEILGLDYEVRVSDFDESIIRETDPVKLTQYLAEAKARQVGVPLEADILVIGGDMVTALGDKIFGKPHDLAEAHQMLSQLSGQTVQIIGAVALYNTYTRKTTSAVSICNVTFRTLTEFEIKDYIERYPVLDYAAAYNGDGVIRFASRVEGADNMSTGFSVNDLTLLLREQGIPV